MLSYQTSQEIVSETSTNINDHAHYYASQNCTTKNKVTTPRQQSYIGNAVNKMKVVGNSVLIQCSGNLTIAPYRLR